jgi:hypothetical protein
MEIYSILRQRFTDLIKENNLEAEDVVVRARPLPPEEAIGNPEEKDFPSDYWQ